MIKSFPVTPAAALWQAFFVFALFCAPWGTELKAQSGKHYRPLPDYVQLGKPDPEVGRKALQEFFQMGISGDYYLELSLHVLPRRGPATVLYGSLWGTRIDGVDLLRLVIKAPSGTETRYLIRRGKAPALWIWHTGDTDPKQLDATEIVKPIAGTTITPFDLQMPYLWWSDSTYEGLAKLRGRPAHRFLMYPPADFAAARPEIAAARISLDTQYGALVESELISAAGQPAKTLSLMELKSVRSQWIVKTIDVRDENTRDKTRLAFSAAALKCSFVGSLFEPESLGSPVSPPAAALIERF